MPSSSHRIGFAGAVGHDGVVNPRERQSRQLRELSWLDRALSERQIEYWLFGGWSVDFHAGRVTRQHDDVDIAVWAADLDEITPLLSTNGWSHRPEPGADGYTCYERDDVRFDLAFLARDSAGVIHTPLSSGRGDWPTGSFGAVRLELDGVQARVVDLRSLIEDKSGERQDSQAAAKDHADVEVLRGIDVG